MSFPIENIRPLTHQEVFDIALRTMRNRNYTKSVNESGLSCMYRSLFGPCAIGACIPDALYDPEMESGTMNGGGISFLLQYQNNFPNIKQLFIGCGLTFLEEIQSCHDSLNKFFTKKEMKESFENAMYKVAQTFNVQFTGLDEQYPTDYDPNKDERYQLK